MVYVYSKHIKSGREDFVNVYDTWENAIAKIRQCYVSDTKYYQENEYYYFAKER